MSKEIETIKKDLVEIKENHLFHVNQDLQVIKTNLDWLMRFFWIIATASISALLASLLSLISK